jgi:hypothetical protein
MDDLRNDKIWAPTADELRQIEAQARYERAKASREAFRFIKRQVSGLFTGERAAQKIRMDGCGV